MSLASATAENAAVNGVTALADYLSMHSGSPSTTGANELTPGGTVAISTITASGGVLTVTTSSAHGLSSGFSTTFAGITGAMAALNGESFVVTVTSTTVFTVVSAVTGSLAGSPTCTTGYGRVQITWGSASGGTAANASSALVSNIPASTTISYFGSYSAQSSGTYEIGGALSSSQTFGTAGTFTIAIGALTLAAS